MNEWIYYGAGIVTPFAATGAYLLIRIALLPDGRWYPNGFCDVCTARGKPVKDDFRTTSTIATFATIKWHTHITARMPKHRREWQHITDNMRPGQLRDRRLTLASRFGTVKN